MTDLELARTLGVDTDKFVRNEHAAALAYGCWQCPQCPGGWQQYMIGGDMNVCPVCGYKGGEVRKNGVDA